MTQTEHIDELLSAAQAALDCLTDHAIDLEGESNEILAGIRIDHADAIAKGKGVQHDQTRLSTKTGRCATASFTAILRYAEGTIQTDRSGAVLRHGPCVPQFKQTVRKLARGPPLRKYLSPIPMKAQD